MIPRPNIRPGRPLGTHKSTEILALLLELSRRSRNVRDFFHSFNSAHWAPSWKVSESWSELEDRLFQGFFLNSRAVQRCRGRRDRPTPPPPAVPPRQNFNYYQCHNQRETLSYRLVSTFPRVRRLFCLTSFLDLTFSLVITDYFGSRSLENFIRGVFNRGLQAAGSHSFSF